jgi:hypothetical protein
METEQRSVKGPVSPIVVGITALVILFVVYFYPRFLVRTLGPADPWTSYLYQYGMGLMVFLVGLALILRTGACQLGRGRDGFWFKVLLGGFVFFAALHALWILAALHIPFLGSVN